MPDLRGRTPIHFGTGGGGTYNLGQTGGEENPTLSVAELPTHTHTPSGTSGPPDAASPAGNYWAAAGQIYAAAPTPGATMHANALANAGGGQPHNNMQPFLVLNFCIALQGLYPSRN